MRKQQLKILAIATIVALVSACNITPTAIEDTKQLHGTYKGLHELLNQQQVVNHEVSLSEAIARTLKYNLDHRVQQTQIMLESGNLKMAYLEMLPAVNANYGYSFRNNNLIQNLSDSSGGVVPGTESYTPRDIVTDSVGLQWNILDLGLSYTRAQMQANRVMIAEEQRRKTTQKLIQEVTTAYWKAWTAQQMIDDVKNFKQKAETALQRSKDASSKKASSPQVELDYQRVLLKSIRQINQLKIQTSDAKFNLARLMNAKPGKDFLLAFPSASLTQLPKIKPQLVKMDALALVNRPELREASYQNEIAKKGIQEAIINMLPGIDFNFGYNHTNNEYILNNEWWGGNVSASWNLVQAVVKGPFAIHMASQAHDFEKLKLVATTMTVLTQLRIAYNSYLLLQEDFSYAKQEANISMKLFNHAIKLEEANQGHEQITIRRGVEALSAQFNREVSFSRAQEALFKLYQSVGLDLLPPDARNHTLKELQASVEQMLKDQSSGKFNERIDNEYEQVQVVLQVVKSEIEAERLGKLAEQQRILDDKLNVILETQNDMLDDMLQEHAGDNKNLSKAQQQKLEGYQEKLHNEKEALNDAYADLVLESTDLLEIKNNLNEEYQEWLVDHHEETTNALNSVKESHNYRHTNAIDDLTYQHESTLENITDAFDDNLESISDQNYNKKEDIADSYYAQKQKVKREYHQGKINEDVYQIRKERVSSEEQAALTKEQQSYNRKLDTIKSKHISIIKNNNQNYSQKFDALNKTHQEKLKANLVNVSQEQTYKQDQQVATHNAKQQKLQMQYDQIMAKQDIIQTKQAELVKENKILLQTLQDKLNNESREKLDMQKNQLTQLNNRFDTQKSAHQQQQGQLNVAKNKVTTEYGVVPDKSSAVPLK